MKESASLLLFAISLSMLLQAVWSDYFLLIKVNSLYNNKESRPFSGDCCHNCDYQCTHKFYFCLSPSGMPYDSLNCSLASRELTHQVRTSPLIGSTVSLRVKANWTGAFQLSVRVDDVTQSPPIPIDTLFFKPEHFPIQNSFTKVYTAYGAYQGTRVSMQLSFRVQCGVHYFGKECSTLCRSTARSNCSPDGQILCKNSQGYYHPPNCRVRCVPRDDESGHYACGSDGTRLCLDGYHGPTCTVHCVSSNNSKGYYQCSENGTKVCLPGFVDPSTNCTMPVNVTYLGNPCMVDKRICGQSQNGEATFSCSCTDGSSDTQFTKELTSLSLQRSSGGTTAAVVAVLLSLFSAAGITIIVVMCIRRHNGSRFSTTNRDLMIPILNSQLSYREGLHNPVYQPQVMGTAHHRSLRAGSDTHVFQNSLYEDSAYSYPILVTSTDRVVPTQTIDNESGVYEVVEYRPESDTTEQSNVHTES